MRSLILLVCAASVLVACTTAPAAVVPPPVAVPLPTAQPTPTPTARSPLAGLLDNAGQPNAPDLASVEHAFGAADVRRQDGAGALLTYRLDTCALLLVFTADAHNTMRLAEAHANARHAGAAAPSLDQCATEVSARIAAHPPA